MSVNIATLQEHKREGRTFAVCTAYDALFSSLLSRHGVELLLVGDSLGMVLQGHDSTLPVTLEDMIYHTACVARGNRGALIMADLPFMSYPDSLSCQNAAARLMRAGAHVIKIEGGAWLADSIQALARQGVPVCAHLGLMPQSVNKLGGYRVQGRDEDSARQMIRDACTLAEAGADLVLLECVPADLAAEVTRAVAVPVIGIGAGNQTDAQVLVLHDLLGLGEGRRPRFVRDFMATADSIAGAIDAYVAAVKSREFPGPEHTFKA